MLLEAFSCAGSSESVSQFMTPDWVTDHVTCHRPFPWFVYICLVTCPFLETVYTVVDKQSHQKFFEHNLGLELYCKVTYLSKEIDWYHFQPCGRIFIDLPIFWLKKKKIKPQNGISVTSEQLE